MQVSCYRNFSVAQEEDRGGLGVVNRRPVGEDRSVYSLEMRSSESTLASLVPDQYIGKQIEGRNSGLLNWRSFSSFTRSILSISAIGKTVTRVGNQTHVRVKEIKDRTYLAYRSSERIYGLIQCAGTFSVRPMQDLRVKLKSVGSFIFDAGRREKLSFCYAYSAQKP